MKIGAVSGDLVIKLALAAAAAGALYYVYKKASGALPGALNYVNPLSDQNAAYQGTNAVLDSLVSEDGPGRNADGSITAGGWWYDIWNPGTNARIRDMLKGTSTGSPAPTPAAAAPIYDPTPGIY